MPIPQLLSILYHSTNLFSMLHMQKHTGVESRNISIQCNKPHQGYTRFESTYTTNNRAHIFSMSTDRGYQSKPIVLRKQLFLSHVNLTTSESPIASKDP
jgi:hypothetical protein